MLLLLRGELDPITAGGGAGDFASRLAQIPSLVAHWRLGWRDVWNTGGESYAINENAEDARLFGAAQGGVTIGGGAALGPADVLATSTDFDGTNDGLEVVHDSALAITGDLTIMAVINPTSLAANRNILGKHSGTAAAPYNLLVTTSGAVRLGLGNGTTDTNTDSTANIPAGQVSLIAVTVTSTTVTHYLNGVANGGGTNSAARSDTGVDLYIGIRDVGGNNPFLGSIQDVAIFNETMSADMVADLYAHWAA